MGHKLVNYLKDNPVVLNERQLAEAELEFDRLHSMAADENISPWLREQKESAMYEVGLVFIRLGYMFERNE